MIHLLGGVLLFAGVTGHIVQTGDVAFTRMALDSPAHWLILIGFLVNAGAPPLSAWLPDAYPEASWSGTVFLSAFTTKTAVYALIRGFPGTELLIWVGLFMVFYGIVYALLENDMRRILAYSIVNQVGFMIAGIGIGTEMALNGAAAHAFTHIIYKALLLMSAGSVLLMTGRRKCSELGGLFHTMPLTTMCGTIGALAISSFPLTSGFVSKSMVSQAAADGHLLTVWLLLTAASAGVFLHAGIKFPWFVFFQKDSGLRPAEPPASMRWAMLLFAFLCVALGVWFEPLYALLPYAVKYEPYTWAHVLTQLQLLLFSGLAFFVMLPYLKRTLTITLDTDWIWRRLLARLAHAMQRQMHRAGRAAPGWRRSSVRWRRPWWCGSTARKPAWPAPGRPAAWRCGCCCCCSATCFCTTSEPDPGVWCSPRLRSGIRRSLAAMTSARAKRMRSIDTGPTRGPANGVPRSPASASSTAAAALRLPTQNAGNSRAGRLQGQAVSNPAQRP